MRTVLIERKGAAMTWHQRRVVAAAMRWWRSHRPVGYTEREHVDAPRVNAWATEADAELALACGGLRAVQLGLPRKGQQ